MKVDISAYRHCPQCGSERAKIIWISKDEKTVGIQCPCSGNGHKKNAVMLMNL